MRISKQQQTEIDYAVALASKLVLIFLAIAAAGLALYYSTSAVVAASSLFVAGLVTFGALLVSWRYYRPHLSIYGWLLFATVVAAVVITAFVLPAVRRGAFEPLGALLAMLGWLGLGVAGPLYVLRGRLRTWFGG